MEELKLVYLPVNALTPYDNNARKHTFHDIEAIKESIKQSGGFNDPIGIWGSNNLIVEGHGRLMAAKELGFSEVPCIRLDHLSEEERKKYALLHNKTAELSEWDFSKLEEELKDLDFEGFDFEFLDDEGEQDTEAEVTEDEPPEVPKEQKTQLGDIYLLGEHRLICGDSTDSDVIERLTDGIKVDMVFTDPPYNCNYGNIKHPKFKQREIKNDNMSTEAFRNFCIDFIMNIKSYCTGCVYMCAGQGQDGRVMFTVADELLHNSTTIIWNKDHFTLGRGKYQNKYEPIWFGWVENGNDFCDDRTLTNVWDIKRPIKSELHPTMKPIELIATALKHNPKSKTVLDLFGGSGSTLIACEQLGRKCFTCELDPHYCDVIVERWINLTGRKNEIICIRDGKQLKYD